jgi:hypothetical protein
MSLRRPRRFVLLVALVATLALLCCGGGITVALVGKLTDEGSTVNTALGCGKGGPVNPDSKLPRIRPYSATQIRNAAIIINTGAKLKMPPRAWVVAVATAMQESRLTNLGNLGSSNDHDSLGLFQQRPSTGWGTPAQVRDPVYASTKFYEKLKTIPRWQNKSLTRAAQSVQISAYPDAYAKHEPLATRIVNLLADGAANAAGDSVSMVCASAGQIAASGWTLPVKDRVPAHASGRGPRRLAVHPDPRGDQRHRLEGQVRRGPQRPSHVQCRRLPRQGRLRLDGGDPERGQHHDPVLPHGAAPVRQGGAKGHGG